MNIHISNLIMEVTRRCNMKCDHCLRGPAQRRDMSMDVVRAILRLGSIGMLTLTGGEPSLKTEWLRDFIHNLIWSRTSIEFIYMVTNGKRVTLDFLEEMRRLIDLTGDPESCYIDMSNDMFHDAEGANGYTKTLWSDFFPNNFRLRNRLETFNLINSGRAKKNQMGTIDAEVGKLSVEKYDSNDITILGEFYVNYKGDIIEGCDWSYNDQKKHVIGTIFDMNTLISKIEKVSMDEVA